MKNYKELEVGSVLELSEDLVLTGNKISVISGGLSVPIGTIDQNDYTWFKETDALADFKMVVYLGNFKFGVKQLTTPYHEFLDELSEDMKQDVFNRLFDDAQILYKKEREESLRS